MKFCKAFVIFCTLWHQIVSGELEELQRRKHMLENQIQTLGREQQYLANQMARNGIAQVENSAKQLHIAQAVQTVAANVLASKGLIDLNGIARFGLSANVLQCYQLNKFTFGDAINSAKSTALQCINDKFNEGNTIVANSIKDIQAAVQDVSGGLQLIAECSKLTVTFPSVAGVVAKVTCLNQAVLTMKGGAILLPINLTRRFFEARAAISTIQSDIVKCNLDILSAIISQSTKAAQAISDCVSQSASVARNHNQ